MRPKLRSFSPWEVVGNDFMAACVAAPGTINGDMVVAVVTVALCPAALSYATRHESAAHLSRVFADFHTAHPDLTLQLLALVRDKWSPASLTAQTQKLRSTDPTTYGFKPAAMLPGHIRPTSQAIGTIKKAVQRIQPPAWRPLISPEMRDALHSLRAAGLPV